MPTWRKPRAWLAANRKLEIRPGPTLPWVALARETGAETDDLGAGARAKSVCWSVRAAYSAARELDCAAALGS